MRVRLRGAEPRNLRHPMVRKVLDTEIEKKQVFVAGGSQIHIESATKAHADERDGFALVGGVSAPRPGIVSGKIARAFRSVRSNV